MTMRSCAPLLVCFFAVNCSASTSPNTSGSSGNASGSAGQTSGSLAGASGSDAGGSGSASSGVVGIGSPDSSAVDMDAGGSAAPDAPANPADSTTGSDVASPGIFDGALPDGAVMSLPAGYKGTPYGGVMQQIPGTIYARNYDLGGQGVAFNHPGATTCGDWPAGMPLYRQGADCVGLSVTNAQKPDVITTGAPAKYGEIYVSYCSTGEWLKFTVEITASGTYVVGGNVAAPNGLSISISFSSVPAVSTGTAAIPASIDAIQPAHEMYHVWQTVTHIGQPITLQAGIYVMTFTIVTAQANFDTFTFTKM
jgi:hypothetical protein